ncbi:hypothetical protein RIF29_24033 [Crotalaria pallida]|uniref:Uncharacterized protein n=1 Tax=Crotalaria pallida TaxID=3830 RepID=A0AAN9EL79_CROPI
MWSSDCNFKDIVQTAWNSEVDGYEMFKFSTKLKKVKRVLLQLNRDRFNSIDKKEAVLKCKLDEVQRNLQLDPGNINLQPAERDIYMEYRKISQQALSFMRQKAKEKWIQDGDQNTSFFHKAIKRRLYRNRVLRVSNLQGNIYTDSISIEQAFQDYYHVLLNGDKKNWNVRHEEMSMGNFLTVEQHIRILKPVTEVLTRKLSFPSITHFIWPPSTYGAKAHGSGVENPISLSPISRRRREPSHSAHLLALLPLKRLLSSNLQPSISFISSRRM